MSPIDTTLDALRHTVQALAGSAADHAGLFDVIGTAPFVLLGEASHGTDDFYRERALVTRRLIMNHGLRAVAVEADWPAAYRINRFVHGDSDDRAPIDALADFKRFPAWMWRNTALLEFIGWLREENARRPTDERVGFYGLDLYSLHESVDAVLGYLDKMDPEAARQARARYACLDHLAIDPETYGYAAVRGLRPSCEDEVVSQLVDLRRRAPDYERRARHRAFRDGRIAADDFFFAEQNARIVTSAEQYYRAMFRGRDTSWNLRDRHMAETLDALVAHLDRQRTGTKIAVWAHNSHLGDARATEMEVRGELNLGQLVRELHGRDAALVGFTTYEGTVTAASDWGGIAERKRVRPGMPRSYEALFHSVSVPRFFIDLHDPVTAQALEGPRLERAVGVIYRPETERFSHYFHARLPEQFDAVLHYDETRAVEPLERTSEWDDGELPATYPSAV